MNSTQKIMRTAIIFFMLLIPIIGLSQNTLPTDQWTYIEIDDNRQKYGDFNEPDWLRYFGLDMQDINYDGYQDVLSGRYIYLNPGDDMMGAWQRVDLGFNVDGMLLVDIDNDEYADVIAESLPSIYWLEAMNTKGTVWSATIIDSIPKTGHVNGQGYKLADVIKGGKPEILLTAHDGIYMAQIPSYPVQGQWDFIRIVASASDEGFAAADIDGDGDLDIVAGDQDEEEEYTRLGWYVNPGTVKSDWVRNPVGETAHAIDRVRAADFNQDGVMDIVISEERYPGKEPDANLYYFEGKNSGNNISWQPEVLITQYSMNNLDVADLDRDGDPDIVTNEHKGSAYQTMLFINDGQGNFTKEVLDTGKEMHLGAQFVDLDQDGDLDLVGHAWDNYQLLHAWRNDAIQTSNEWTHLSSEKGDLPNTAGGAQQTASLLADVDNDQVPEFFITDRSVQNSVIMYKRQGNTWQKFVVESENLRIEAGSAATDIDGDGDTDIVFAGESQSNEVWWWENPYPNFDPNQPWIRYTIKKSGANKHHDQLFGDFDGDGEQELVFWNQGANTLFMAEIPDNPKSQKEWDYQPIYQYHNDSQMEPLVGIGGYPGWSSVNEHEGLAKTDIDGDGLEDIVGGGRWFKFQDGKFQENIIDARYTFSRSVAGQLIEGGRPEIVLVVGDGIGPMYLYQWIEKRDSGHGTWQPTMILPEVDNGHTLDILDFNQDGHLDIFTAEMRFGEGNPDSEIRILLGDGKGKFRKLVVAEGMGVHEGRIADLDGDGDYDVLAKPYSWEAPRIDLFINQKK